MASLALALLLAAAPAASTPAASAPAAPAGGAGPELITRRIVAETALAQVKQLDPAWTEPQRDCAGLVRFAYRTAFRRTAPERVAAGPFRDRGGEPTQFADAATLLAGSFAPLGRGDAAREALRSGDLVAFAREDESGAPVHHLMIVVRDRNAARGRLLVVYHPGERGAAVRLGRLDDLETNAPPGWRPVPQNPLFLGFYRLKEWSP